MERGNQKLTSPIPRRTLIWSCTLIALACLIGYRLFVPLSPEAIRDRAIAALEKRDAQELCRLADAEELQRLHLTEATVAEFLQHTLWNESALQHARVDKVSQTQDDQSVWQVHWASEKSETLSQVVPIVDDPHKGWKLNLSFLLYSSCWRKEKGKEGMRTYLQLAQQYGIEGERIQGGQYKSMDGLMQEEKNVFGN